MPKRDQPVSSSEMTGLCRSSYPEISFDNLTKRLISEEAKSQTDAFISKHNYPLFARKFSARAGYLFIQGQRLIDEYNCDCIISFACGYSMLGYLLAQQCKRKVSVIDTDLVDIISNRVKRIKQLMTNDHQLDTLSQIKHSVFDIEQASTENIDLASYFGDWKRPLVILEGITYFLKPETKDWLLKALQKWTRAIILFDYWPENSLDISAKLRNAFEQDLNKDIKENLKSFILDKDIKALKERYHAIDISIGDAETELSRRANQSPQLLNQNEFFPIRIFIGVHR